MKNKPCLNCEVRRVGCHSKCSMYAEYRKEARLVWEYRNETKKIPMYFK